MRKRRELDYGYDGGGCCCFNPFDGSGIGIYNHDLADTDISLQAGPSRITIDDLEREEQERDTWRLSAITDSTNTRETGLRRRRKKRLPLSSAAIALPFLPLAFAAPPLPLRSDTSHPLSITSNPSPPGPTPTRRRRQEVEPESRLDDDSIIAEINYLTSMSTPTILPTDVYVVAETRLPYVLTQNQDGSWTKVDNAWFLYGRQAGVSTALFGNDADPQATAIPTSISGGMDQFAITDALPPGWGIEASRSTFYITPLIVAMSIILALMIVAGIIFIVIKRRKQQRRAKRRAARQRRKALAAAGLTEDDLNTNNGGEGIDEMLREKLRQIDGIPKPKSPKKERGPTAVIRTKVRSWNQGVLRRRGKAGLGPSRSLTPSSLEVIEDIKPEEDSGRRSNDTSRTTPTVASHSSIDRGHTSGSGGGLTSDIQSSSDLSRTIPLPPSTSTYFPPAYRPASVRSLGMQNARAEAPPPTASSSTSARPGDGRPRAVSAGEKTNAPGYYPAPATEESETALAVASRSDGKQRMEAPPIDEEEENRTRHIATDDKQVLERMRMGASAPPQQDGHADGPSAPMVEVDEQGFERHDPTQLAPIVATTSPRSAESSSELPAPPSRPAMAYRRYSHDDLAASLGVEDVPSAPPPAHEDHQAPSAPPLTEEAQHAPTAPAFDLDEEPEQSDSAAEGGDEYARTDTNDTRESEDEPAVLVVPSTTGVDVRKPSLPTYEP